MKFNNETILDLRRGYSHEDIENYIDGLNDSGRNYYVKKFHLIDTFYSIVYGIFYIITLSYLTKNIFGKNKFVKFVLLIPIIGIICDYGENILIDSFIKNVNNMSRNISTLSSSMTIIKFITVYFSLLLIIILIICLIIKKIKLKKYNKR
jgi:hypothetical protein